MRNSRRKSTTGIIPEVGESVTETASEISNVSEEIAKMQSHSAEAVDSMAAASTSVVTVIPVVGDFVKGLNHGNEAYRAWQDPHMPQRKAKIATGLFGAAVFCGLGITSSLYLAHVGLLATIGAAVAMPIVLASAALGVYAVTVARDSYEVHQSRMAIKEKKDAIKNLTKEYEKNPRAFGQNPQQCYAQIIKEQTTSLAKLKQRRDNQAIRLASNTVILAGAVLICAAALVVMTGGAAIPALAVAGGLAIGISASARLLHTGYQKWREHFKKPTEKPDVRQTENARESHPQTPEHDNILRASSAPSNDRVHSVDHHFSTLSMAEKLEQEFEHHVAEKNEISHFLKAENIDEGGIAENNQKKSNVIQLKSADTTPRSNVTRKSASDSGDDSDSDSDSEGESHRNTL
ncbi:MAG: hypothetical protein SFW66_07505 [Gammaproteobacteria bacterium]|nr:hypothetical protein [Gammaproteobacteria bacterium]